MKQIAIKQIDKLTCDNGAKITQFQVQELLHYNRHKEAVTYKVRYTIGMDHRGQGEYSLYGIVARRTPSDNEDKYLSEIESLPIVQEIRDQLKKAGFFVSAMIAEDE